MAEQPRFVCKYCGSEVEHRSQYNTPSRWVHVPSLDYRCLLFAEPFAPFGSPVSVPALGRGVAQEAQQ